MHDRHREVDPSMFRGLHDLRKLIEYFRSRGPRAAMGQILHSLVWRYHTQSDRHFDRDHGVDTSTHAYSWDLDMRSEGDDIGTEEPMYLPTSTLAFRSIMRNLPADLSDYVFIDFGSGKGRTLILAAEFNFRQIIGVEFASELHDIAAKNVENYSSASQKCFDLRSDLVDATIFDIPESPCVHYFFNPFEEVVMRKVTERIRSSYERNPRKMYLVYYKPKFPEILTEQAFLKPVRIRKPLLPNPYDLEIFETE